MTCHHLTGETEKDKQEKTRFPETLVAPAQLWRGLIPACPDVGRIVSHSRETSMKPGRPNIGSHDHLCISARSIVTSVTYLILELVKRHLNHCSPVP